MLYQVWSLVRTIEDAFQPGASISLDNVLSHTDQLILSVVNTLEGAEEAEIVRYLLRLRDALTRQKAGRELGAEATAPSTTVMAHWPTARRT